eukprot:252481-Pleurochrysis_carterae.AAC.7
MVRNHHNVDMRALHRECRVGTKRVIEDYVAEVVTSMQWLQNLDTARLSAADKYRIFERYSMCLGHTALCLSGGGSLSMCVPCRRSSRACACALVVCAHTRTAACARSRAH